jgi:hypothetical protein
MASQTCACNLESLALHMQSLPQSRLHRAKVVPRKTLADQRGVMSIGIVEHAAGDGCQREDTPESGVDEGHSGIDRMAAQLNPEIAARVKAYSFKAPRLVADIGSIGPGDALGGMSGVGPAGIENGETIRIGVGQRR